MSGSRLLSGNVSYSITGQSLTVVSGSVTIGGGLDTLFSANADVGIVITGDNNVLSITGAADTITAGAAGAGGSNYNSLIIDGDGDVVNDAGLNESGVTINGSGVHFTSQQRVETTTMVINGDNDTVTALYVSGNFVINGNDVSIIVGSGNITVNGTNDTVTASNATSILVAGIDDTVTNDALAGFAVPAALLAGEAAAAADTTAGATISITGAGANVTSYANNTSVSSSAGNASVSLLSYGNSVVASGGSTSITTETSTESVTVSGGASTVSTSTFITGTTTTAASTTVSVAASASTSTTYNSGGGTVTDTTAGSGADTVNLSSGGTSVVATSSHLFTDSVGGNAFTVSGVTQLDITAGNDTVTVIDGSQITQDTLGGGYITTLLLGSGDNYDAAYSGLDNTKTIISVSGSGNSGMLFGSAEDTLLAGGSNNIFSIVANPKSTVAGGLESINGANTLSVFTGNNSIIGENGASLFVSSSNNSITGAGASLNLVGNANRVVLTGSDTVSDASPWDYTNGSSATTVQNSFTVQSGQFNLGGLDNLVQQSGSGAFTLAGGNQVTLNGASDSIVAYDQVYAGNNILLTGANDSVTLVNVSDSAATISATANAFVRATDSDGAKIGGTNTNSGETLTFIGASYTSSTVIASGSNTQVTLYGGSSDVVYGGQAGNNSLVGGSGGNDLFVAGGNNDVLVGGSAGNNTLVSSGGNETLTGAGLGNDVFSISGGTGIDLIQDFSGQLVLAKGLSVASAASSSAGYTVTLNDGTHIIFAGLASVNQTGNVFTV